MSRIPKEIVDLIVQEKLPEALEGALVIVEQGESDASRCTSLCVIYSLLGERENAREFCRKASRLAPESAWIASTYTLALMATGFTYEAVEEMDRFLSVFPDEEAFDVEIEETVPYLFTMPQTLVQRIRANPELYATVRSQGALSPLVFPEVVGKYRESGGHSHVDARAEGDLSESPSPEVLKEDALGRPISRLQPDSRCEPVWNLMEEGDYELAIEHALELRRNPELDPEITLLLCNTYANAEMSEPACRECSRAVKLAPCFWRVSFRLFESLCQLGRKEEAVRELDRFLLEFPETPLFDWCLDAIVSPDTPLPASVIRRIENSSELSARFIPGTLPGTFGLRPGIETSERGKAMLASLLGWRDE